MTETMKMFALFCLYLRIVGIAFASTSINPVSEAIQEMNRVKSRALELESKFEASREEMVAKVDSFLPKEEFELKRDLKTLIGRIGNGINRFVSFNYPEDSAATANLEKYQKTMDGYIKNLFSIEKFYAEIKADYDKLMTPKPPAPVIDTSTLSGRIRNFEKKIEDFAKKAGAVYLLVLQLKIPAAPAFDSVRTTEEAVLKDCKEVALKLKTMSTSADLDYCRFVAEDTFPFQDDIDSADSILKAKRDEAEGLVANLNVSLEILRIWTTSIREELIAPFVERYTAIENGLKKSSTDLRRYKDFLRGVSERVEMISATFIIDSEAVTLLQTELPSNAEIKGFVEVTPAFLESIEIFFNLLKGVKVLAVDEYALHPRPERIQEDYDEVRKIIEGVDKIGERTEKMMAAIRIVEEVLEQVVEKLMGQFKDALSKAKAEDVNIQEMAKNIQKMEVVLSDVNYQAMSDLISPIGDFTQRFSVLQKKLSDWITFDLMQKYKMNKSVLMLEGEVTAFIDFLSKFDGVKMGLKQELDELQQQFEQMKAIVDDDLLDKRKRKLESACEDRIDEIVNYLGIFQKFSYHYFIENVELERTTFYKALPTALMLFDEKKILDFTACNTRLEDYLTQCRKMLIEIKDKETADIELDEAFIKDQTHVKHIVEAIRVIETYDQIQDHFFKNHLDEIEEQCRALKGVLNSQIEQLWKELMAAKRLIQSKEIGDSVSKLSRIRMNINEKLINFDPSAIKGENWPNLEARLIDKQHSLEDHAKSILEVFRSYSKVIAQFVKGAGWKDSAKKLWLQIVFSRNKLFEDLVNGLDKVREGGSTDYLSLMKSFFEDTNLFALAASKVKGIIQGMERKVAGCMCALTSKMMKRDKEIDDKRGEVKDRCDVLLLKFIDLRDVVGDLGMNSEVKSIEETLKTLEGISIDNKRKKHPLEVLDMWLMDIEMGECLVMDLNKMVIEQREHFAIKQAEDETLLASSKDLKDRHKKIKSKLGVALKTVEGYVEECFKLAKINGILGTFPCEADSSKELLSVRALSNRLPDVQIVDRRNVVTLHKFVKDLDEIDCYCSNVDAIAAKTNDVINEASTLKILVDERRKEITYEVNNYFDYLQAYESILLSMKGDLKAYQILDIIADMHLGHIQNKRFDVTSVLDSALVWTVQVADELEKTLYEAKQFKGQMSITFDYIFTKAKTLQIPYLERATAIFGVMKKEISELIIKMNDVSGSLDKYGIKEASECLRKKKELESISLPAHDHTTLILDAEKSEYVRKALDHSAIVKGFKEALLIYEGLLQKAIHEMPERLNSAIQRKTRLLADLELIKRKLEATEKTLASWKVEKDAEYSSMKQSPDLIAASIAKINTPVADATLAIENIIEFEEAIQGKVNEFDEIQLYLMCVLGSISEKQKSIIASIEDIKGQQLDLLEQIKMVLPLYLQFRDHMEANSASFQKIEILRAGSAYFSMKSLHHLVHTLTFPDMDRLRLEDYEMVKKTMGDYENWFEAYTLKKEEIKLKLSKI